MYSETVTAVAPDAHRLSAGKFARHFIEMVAAMAVGMLVLHPVWMFVLDAVGAAGLMHNPYTGALIMATNMTVAMVVWMRYRGHGWAATNEMALAMYLPFFVLFPPLWLGFITPATMLTGGHLLMLPAMAGAMLLRRNEYTGHHHDQHDGF